MRNRRWRDGSIEPPFSPATTPCALNAFVNITNKDALEAFPELDRLTPLDYLRQLDEESLVQFEETIDGDFVKLQAPDKQSDEFILVRHEGAWKVSVDRMTCT